MIESLYFFICKYFYDGVEESKKKELSTKEKKREIQDKKHGLERRDSWKEAQKKEVVIVGKSKEFAKCETLLNEANKAFMVNEMEYAKKFYIESRNIYIRLKDSEKAKVYQKLADIYKKLKGIGRKV